MPKFLLFLLTFFLNFSQIGFAEEGVTSSKTSFWQPAILIGVALVFFYFILWRPEQKRRKAVEEKRNSMKSGDKVSAVGIIGIIDKINENTVILKMVDGTKIEVIKSAITDIIADKDSSNK